MVTFPCSAALSTGDVGVKGSTYRRLRLPKVRKPRSFFLLPPSVRTSLRFELLGRAIEDLAHGRVKRLSPPRRGAHENKLGVNQSKQEAELNRAETNQTEPNRTEPNRTEPNRTAPHRTELNRAKTNRTEQNRTKPNRIGLGPVYTRRDAEFRSLRVAKL